MLLEDELAQAIRSASKVAQDPATDSSAHAGDDDDESAAKVSAHVVRLITDTAGAEKSAETAFHTNVTDKIAVLVEEKVDEEMRRKFITYQYNHFKLLSQAPLTDIQKLRALRQRAPGEALEADEQLAMTLEDTMVWG